MTGVRESTIHKKCLDWLNAIPGCHAEKQHGSVYGHQRLDILLCFRGRFGWVEVKRPGDHPTKLQAFTMEKWAIKAGAWCVCVHSLEELQHEFMTHFEI